MTVDQIFQAINKAPQDQRHDLAEDLVQSYEGPDKEIVRAWIFEMVAALDF